MLKIVRVLDPQIFKEFSVNYTYMRFEGEDISRIEGPPSRMWGKDHFLKDWEHEVKEHSVLDKESIRKTREGIMIPIHEEYVGLFDLINTENGTSEEQKERMMSRLNLALGNVAEIGIRDIKHIFLSLNDQKYGRGWAEPVVQEVFDPIIDMLINKLHQLTDESARK